MAIQKIRIRNFRSLTDVSIDVESLTVFVGCNDAGKSNILRALDLFFNGDGNKYQLDWPRDFCGFARAGKGKAKEIKIALTFKLPDSYNVKGRVEWTKTWRQMGRHSETIKQEDGTELPSRSKAVSYLRSICYEYVPAIKGTDYFDTLLSSVHDMLETTARESIRAASASFTGTIRNHTTGILEDLSDQLDLTSDLSLPTDLRQLFSALEFRSQTGAHSVGLSQRGDGIKVRHIPIILHWMAQQANHKHVAAAGRPRVETIWGYEEPENNLEAKSAFELAGHLLKWQKEGIQIFLTTHSPVFYTELLRTGQENVRLCEVQKTSDSGSSVLERDPEKAEDIEALDGSIGFLRQIEPYIRDWKKQAENLKLQISQLPDKTKPTIFVEGPSDRQILEAVFRKYPCQDTPSVKCAQQNGGGHQWVRDSLIAWHFSRPAAYAVGLFDLDSDAKKSLKDFHQKVADAVDGKTKARAIKLSCGGMALEIIKLQVRLQAAIEEICPREAWEHARRNGWCELRSVPPHAFGFSETNQTFENWLEGKISDEFLRFVARNRIKPDCKEKFSKHVAKLIDEDISCDIAPLKNLRDELFQKLQ